MTSVIFICQTTQLPDDPITQFGRWVIGSHGHLTTEFDTGHCQDFDLPAQNFDLNRYPRSGGFVKKSVWLLFGFRCDRGSVDERIA